jgi:hypothetical protein
VDKIEDWPIDDEIFVQVGADSSGFAYVHSPSHEVPGNGSDFIRVRIDGNTSGGGKSTIRIELPFERFYMDETKAEDAESAHRNAMRDTGHVTYAVVHVKDGESVIRDVMIDEVSIRTLVETQAEPE